MNFANNKLYIITALVSLVILMVFLSNNSSKEFNSKDLQNSNHDREMSMLLQNAMRNIGQLSCNLSKIDVSINGGWCSKISGTISSFKKKLS